MDGHSKMGIHKNLDRNINWTVKVNSVTYKKSKNLNGMILSDPRSDQTYFYTDKQTVYGQIVQKPVETRENCSITLL